MVATEARDAADADEGRESLAFRMRVTIGGASEEDFGEEQGGIKGDLSVPLGGAGEVGIDQLDPSALLGDAWSPLPQLPPLLGMRVWRGVGGLLHRSCGRHRTAHVCHRL